MSKANKSYCRVAFDSVTISPTGRMQLCCESQWPGKPQDEPRVEDIKSIDGWFNGDYMKGVRKAMLAGHRIKECSTCYDKERLHKKSSRIQTNEEWLETDVKKNLEDLDNIKPQYHTRMDSISELIDRQSEADRTEHSIKKLDLKLGNKCNLKCKMCFPFASSELWKEWKDLGWNSAEKDPNNDTSWKYYDGYFEEDYAWPKNPQNIEKIKEAAVKSKRIHVTGGEPTINPEFFLLLRHCISEGVAKDITLSVTTNATKIHPRFFEMAREFKDLRLTISMDGVGKTYEYVRYPANFDKVYNNIKRYSEFVKTLSKDSRLIINFILQVWNLHNVVDAIKTLAPLSVNADFLSFKIEEVREPRFMRWGMLSPVEVKKVTKQIATELRANHDQKVRWPIIALSRLMNAYKEYKTEDFDIEKLRLREFTEKQDKHRGIDLKDYVPEVQHLFR